MLTVSKKAAAVLKAAKAAQGAPPEAGVRIVKGAMPDDSGKSALAVGLASAKIRLRMTKSSNRMGCGSLSRTPIEPLDGRTLDVSEGNNGPELTFR
jgi:hypothetical protein